MEYLEAYRKNKSSYIPEFIDSLDYETCIGCGRCYKICGEGVFELMERDELELENDDYDDEGAQVMVIAHDENCIGCGACARVCPRKCHEFTRIAA